MHLRGNECAERRNEGSRAAFLESALDDRGINVKPKSEEKIKREKEREREKKEDRAVETALTAEKRAIFVSHHSW